MQSQNIMEIHKFSQQKSLGLKEQAMVYDYILKLCFTFEYIFLNRK